MKVLFTLLLSLSLLQVEASPIFEKLCEVNRLWKEQADVTGMPDYAVKTGKDWIRLHLTLVEQTLKNRDVKHLTLQQRQNRLRSLDQLHEYMLAGNFPINEDYAYRTPIFIDNHDNFCAVGYLVKVSGNEPVSRKIAANTNLAYVREMKYPELFAWANEYGFTVDELAWIQPAYPPLCTTAPVGRGTNGEVFELVPDKTNTKLYVGGVFSTVDSIISASNIAYLTELNGNHTWHSMGTGVNGPVYAIAEHDNKVFVAGSFTMAGSQNVTNVAYWDGSSWHGAGCTYGTIKDLVVFNGELYAAGHFDVCAAMSEVNFAKWNGTGWQQIPGLVGTVNTLEVHGSSILLGGNFDTAIPRNVMKWTPVNGFEPFSNSIVNEVRDFEVFGDTMYAVCKRIDANDSLVFLKLKNDAWVSGHTYPVAGSYTFNTLCVRHSSLQVGGDFNVPALVGTSAWNSWDLTPPSGSYNNFFTVDSTVNKLVMFKGSMYAGGKFNYSYTWSTTELNSMAKITGGLSVKDPLGLAASFDLFPNPVRSGGSVTLRNNFHAQRFIMMDVNGKRIADQHISKSSEVFSLPLLAAGVYFAELINGNGEKAVKKIIIE